MQTLTEVAKEIIRWERVALPKGAHRIQHIGRVSANEVSASGFKDCSYDEWFIDDLISVKATLGLVGGIWCGLMLGHETMMVVLALRLE